APGTEILSTYPTIDTHVEDDFETDDFAARWTPGRRGFGRVGPGDGPLTSFGITDTPGADSAASTLYEVTLSAAVAIPAGAGACQLSGRRFVSLGDDGTFIYSIVPDAGPSIDFTPGSTLGSTLAPFSTVSVRDLGGRTVRLRFAYTAPSVPEAANGLWLDDLLLECYAPLAAAPTYDFLEGTSMAAPHVSGAAGLLVSLNPAATTEQVRAALLASVDPLASLAGRTTTGGRIDAASALDEIRQPDTGIASVPRRSTRSRRATFAFARVDAPFPASFECQLDGGVFAACGSPTTYTGLRGGRHAFAVRARSPRGIVADLTPATASWTVTQCKVPRLKGKTLRRARRALRRARCTLGRVRRPRRARGAARRGRPHVRLVVRSSRPRAGAIRLDGARVKVTLKPKPRPRRRASRRRGR
ncbi:MAG TPA: S8 family serine peptidase, partial [Conexibacter sp.]|nr:S8 family serine peptidase [Conexibacter sp.]